VGVIGSPARPGRVLLGWRPARPRRQRLPAGASGRRSTARGRGAFSRHRPACADAAAPKAGRGDGGGICDRRRSRLHSSANLTIAAENARFGQVGRRSGPSTAVSAAGCWRPGRAEKAQGDLVQCASTAPRRHSRWNGQHGGPARATRARDGHVVPGDAFALSPFSLRLLKASFKRRRGRLAGIPAASPTTPTLLFYESEEAQEGRNAYREKRKPDFSQFPRRADERGSDLVMARGCVRCRPLLLPFLVGTSWALGMGTLSAPFVAALLGAILSRSGQNCQTTTPTRRRGADTEDRLGPRAGHRGGLVPPSQVLLATYVTFGLAVDCRHLPDRRGRLGAAGVGAASILAGVLYTGGPRPMGTRASASCSCSCVFAWSRSAAPTSSSSVAPLGRLSSAPCRSACWRARSFVVNNSATRTDRRAGQRTHGRAPRP